MRGEHRLFNLRGRADHDITAASPAGERIATCARTRTEYFVNNGFVTGCCEAWRVYVRASVSAQPGRQPFVVQRTFLLSAAGRPDALLSREPSERAALEPMKQEAQALFFRSHSGARTACGWTAQQ